jgi:hypothetical protein
MESSNMNKNIYKKSKIYKIVDVGYNEQYFGSTVVELSTRMSRHRAKYKETKQTKSAYSCTAFLIFDKYGVENCKIELVEHYPCESKEELRKREGHWMKQEPCVNKRMAGRTKPEYYLEHKERIQEYRKQYKQEHKDDITERGKHYRLHNAEKIKEDTRQYWLNNTERIKEKHKAYYRENIDNIKAKNKERVECQHCSKLICRYCLKRHIQKMHTVDTDK